jgi:hypothetical protein
MAFQLFSPCQCGRSVDFSHPGVTIEIAYVMRQVEPELAIMDCRSCRWFRSILMSALPEK